MDQLRARAYLDLLTGTDSRPGATPGQDGTGPVPAGFAARGTLTVPLVTLVGLSDHPGELPGFGPVDPWLARDLADAAAARPPDLLVRDRGAPRGALGSGGGARPRPFRCRSSGMKLEAA